MLSTIAGVGIWGHIWFHKLQGFLRPVNQLNLWWYWGNSRCWHSQYMAFLKPIPVTMPPPHPCHLISMRICPHSFPLFTTILGHTIGSHTSWLSNHVCHVSITPFLIHHSIPTTQLCLSGLTTYPFLPCLSPCKHVSPHFPYPMHITTLIYPLTHFSYHLSLSIPTCLLLTHLSYPSPSSPFKFPLSIPTHQVRSSH